MEDTEAPQNKCQKTEFRHSDKSNEEETRSVPLLQGYHVQILEAGIGKVRSELFRKRIMELGGTLCSSISDRPNALIVDENMTADRLCRLLKTGGPQELESMTVVRSLWLSDCIKTKKLLPTVNYELQLTSSVSSAKVNQPTSQKAGSPPATTQDAARCSKFSSCHWNEDSEADSNYAASGEDDSEDEATVSKRRPLPVCIVYSHLQKLCCLAIFLVPTVCLYVFYYFICKQDV